MSCKLCDETSSLTTDRQRFKLLATEHMRAICFLLRIKINPLSYTKKKKNRDSWAWESYISEFILTKSMISTGNTLSITTPPTTITPTYLTSVPLLWARHQAEVSRCAVTGYTHLSSLTVIERGTDYYVKSFKGNTKIKQTEQIRFKLSKLVELRLKSTNT